jgi:hypothetical protein
MVATGLGGSSAVGGPVPEPTGCGSPVGAMVAPGLTMVLGGLADH